ncbi:MAG: heavy metal translocating P-type ATPase metal-binding domain-containing protein [Ignavibacteriales bacterium]|nr:heavy metal translocating P-type ATPase metal-binding domain-containing protein [Ignavibacteriales bacterium]
MKAVNQISISEKLICFHCGEECSDNEIKINEKVFCCNGCKTVYELLDANDLCTYYSIDENPGLTQKNDIKKNFDFLDDSDLKEKLIDFTDGKITSITFSIPQVHCSSCIWILENLYKMDSGIIHSEANFLKKIVSIKFDESKTSLKKIVILLDSIGYQPDLNLAEKEVEKSAIINKKLWYKIGVAGFAAGNIMLFSFPEYLSLNEITTDSVKPVFSYLNVLFALPVFFYSASDYFISAYKGLRKKIVNIDVPISIGIIVLFLRSLYEIFSRTGAGYLDSMTALVFFMIVGKMFQSKTYAALNFERNYKSYFPIAVTILKNKIETTKPVEKLEVKDRIIIKNGELIPADSVLINGNAFIDYSFVTGESNPVEKVNGDLIYAGGRQVGGAIEVEIIKEVSQSYLTQLWNNKTFQKEDDSRIDAFVNIVSKYFTIVILFIAASAAFYWLPINKSIAFNSLTAVLIIACPCALALSTPFTLGNSLRIFGRNKFYLKSTHVIEKLSKITSIVFDKTGTITETQNANVEFIGDNLSEFEIKLVKSLVHNSSHPLSKNIFRIFPNAELFKIFEYQEIPGQGISAIIDGIKVQIGSKVYVSETKEKVENNLSTKVFLAFDDKTRGFFKISNSYRENLKEVISALQNDYKLSLLSGDNDSERKLLAEYFNPETEMLFKQSPFDKLKCIEKMQENGEQVLMIGDGLNDAGALKKSNVGISIAENINNFSPACDGILDSQSFNKLDDFIKFSKTSKNIIIISFIISFFYNVIGLSFAVQGKLSPVVSAILMPLSSISVVAFATLTTNLMAKRRNLL